MIIIVPVDVNLKCEPEARNMVHPTIVRRINALCLWLESQAFSQVRVVHTKQTAEFADLLLARVKRLPDPQKIELQEDHRLVGIPQEGSPTCNLGQEFSQVLETLVLLVPIDVLVLTLHQFGWKAPFPELGEHIFGQLGITNAATSRWIDYRPCLFGQEAKQLLPPPPAEEIILPEGEARRAQEGQGVGK